jgi:hypothetical protein
MVPGTLLSFRMSDSRLKQRIKSPVAFHKKVCDRSCCFVLSWSHPLPPIMSTSEGGKGSREKFDTIDISARGRGDQNVECPPFAPPLPYGQAAFAGVADVRG